MSLTGWRDSRGQAALRRSVLRLPHRLDVLPAARRKLRADLADWGVPAAAREDAERVITALLTYTVKHARALAGGVMVLRWRVTDGLLTIRITDGGVGRDAAEPLPAAQGRGLRLVARISRSWGSTDHVGGLRTLWASIPLDAPPRLRLLPLR
jgi:serine/threonine-protein kinase RsbW